MMLQVNPQFHVYVPHADDFMLVWFVTDYHTEEHLYWTGAMEKTGEVWTISNEKIRACRNPSIGRSMGGEDVVRNLDLRDVGAVHAGRRAYPLVSGSHHRSPPRRRPKKRR